MVLNYRKNNVWKLKRKAEKIIKYEKKLKKK